MFFFLIKKAFFDAWDNLAVIILSNLAVFLVLIAGLWPVMRILENGSLAGLSFLILLIPLLFVVGGGVSSLVSIVSDYKRATWSDVPVSMKASWRDSLFFGVVLAVFFLISGFGMTYYAQLKNSLGLGAMALLFWISLGVYLAALWFYPVKNRLTGGFGKSLKKSALLMLDNLGLTLFIGIVVVPLQLALWPLTAFGAFGPAGISLYLDGALRLLMFKYDWLEEHPDLTKRDVPWFELLLDERERVGKRTLKGMIFPWKE